MILSLEKVSLNFGGIKAVQELSLSIKKGEIFALVGPNGAGKSTVFNIISRFYSNNSGIIKFEGNIINDLKPFQLST